MGLSNVLTDSRRRNVLCMHGQPHMRWVCTDCGPRRHVHVCECMFRTKNKYVTYRRNQSLHHVPQKTSCDCCSLLPLWQARVSTSAGHIAQQEDTSSDWQEVCLLLCRARPAESSREDPRVHDPSLLWIQTPKTLESHPSHGLSQETSPSNCGVAQPSSWPQTCVHSLRLEQTHPKPSEPQPSVVLVCRCTSSRFQRLPDQPVLEPDRSNLPGKTCAQLQPWLECRPVFAFADC